MTLKERVKNLCKNEGVSMNQLEKELGFATGYISKLDKSTPSSKYIQKIADYFNVSVDYLMTGKEPTLTIGNVEIDAELLLMSKKLKEYALKIRDLSEDKQEAVFNVIDLLLVEKTEVEEWKRL